MEEERSVAVGLIIQGSMGHVKRPTDRGFRMLRKLLAIDIL